ncbi:unnamed protein product [Ambrosiozyma monospora]|uniref:Unnamed protein product n=1 Tax=Ambrosiozyma monospora TaxID=43982 RepID=A0A9W7DDX7_AMBMO|nr:unnamed protein product [Ambrosiozyma monospora]
MLLKASHTTVPEVDQDHRHDHEDCTCREIQESQGEHTNMVLAVTYKTSRLYFGNTFDQKLHINDEDEVILKILDLFFVGRWFKLHRFVNHELKKEKLNEFRANVNNEISIYKHIWKHNSRVHNIDSERFIHVPKLIHYGEVPRERLQSLDVTSGTSEIDKELEASGDLNIRYLRGPYLVVEYLKGMRPPHGEEEHAEVEKELAKLEKIGVNYRDHRDPNFLFDPKTRKAYILDFEHARLTV